jgi:hypothetical protein
MPKRISKPKRPVPRLTPAQKNFFRQLDACGDAFSFENVAKLYAGVVPLRGNHQDTPIGRWPPEQREAYVRQWAEGNLTTGPERTPLKPWTPEQVEAYKKQRIEETLGKGDDLQELP